MIVRYSIRIGLPIRPAPSEVDYPRAFHFGAVALPPAAFYTVYAWLVSKHSGKVSTGSGEHLTAIRQLRAM